ncbi:MAG TPA: ABC transporter substrate-binding protein [Epulopiscium sp.]|nr:ABC transporter substrate-binding protein [Candidatus Epulonipiscium sp.]
MKKQCIKKHIIMPIVLTMALFILVGCGSKTKEEVVGETEIIGKNELVMAIGSEPDEGFDPIVGWGRYGNPLFQSTLIDTDANMDIVYDLATEYSISPDGLIWEFILRDDAKFTDGEAVKASDVAFTFEKAKTSGSIIDLTNIKDIECPDGRTVKFNLEKADSSFAHTVVATGIVPEHAYNGSYGENPIGSGPFILKQWDKGQQIIMVANEDYYGHVPEIKKVTILFMEEDTALAAAKAGQLDVAVTAANLADQSIDGMELAVIKSIDNRGLTLPYLKDEGKVDENGNKMGNNVTSDLSIRRALSYGINRNNLITDVINGYGRPAYTECDGMPWGNDEAVVEYDLEKAKEILESAGWTLGNDGIRVKEGVKAEFNLLYSASDSTRQALATGVSLQAKALGIAITTEGSSWDIIEQRMFSEPVLMGWGAQNPKETYLLYHSDNAGRDYYNPEYFSNPVTDGYIESAMAALSPEEATAYWKKVQWDGETGLATEGESPWVWLVNVDHLYYVKEGLNIGAQKIHPHGHAWPLVANLKDWKWN